VNSAAPSAAPKSTSEKGEEMWGGKVRL
jgi:hypothetical protein